MTSSDGFDRPLSAWLEEEAAMRAPADLLPQVIDRAAHTRRRPGWATTGRWISMEARAQLGAVPRSVIILATLALLTVLAAGAGLIVQAGGSGTTALLPTGPAANGLIAYSADGDIWVVNPDGSDARQFTSGPADDHAASWSRDGTRLAYWSVDPSGAPSTLVVVEADGSSDPVEAFTDDAGRTPIAVDWSPDGALIAFTLCPDVMCGDFFVVAAEGTGSTSVGGPEFEAHVLAWSPDGTTIAFGGRHDGGPRGVYLMAADGSDVRRISQLTTSDEDTNFAAVEWSPDGDRILTHASALGDDVDIWTIAADGTGDLNLTEGPATGFLPRWSPDGAWAAFRDGDMIFLVPGAGGEVRTFGRGEGFAWSPDGKALALESVRRLNIVDVLTGDTVAELADVPSVESWQRLAP